MRIRVIDTIGELADDMAGIARQVRPDMQKVTLDSARDGNRIARGFAKESAGAHGKHYYKAFTAEANKARGFGGVGLISSEYGPDISRPQGEMSFERGSRNQPPHLDLARSADLIAPWFDVSVQETVAGWFW